MWNWELLDGGWEFAWIQAPAKHLARKLKMLCLQEALLEAKYALLNLCWTPGKWLTLCLPLTDIALDCDLNCEGRQNRSFVDKVRWLNLDPERGMEVSIDLVWVRRGKAITSIPLPPSWCRGRESQMGSRHGLGCSFTRRKIITKNYQVYTCPGLGYALLYGEKSFWNVSLAQGSANFFCKCKIVNISGIEKCLCCNSSILPL